MYLFENLNPEVQNWRCGNPPSTKNLVGAEGVACLLLVFKQQLKQLRIHLGQRNWDAFWESLTPKRPAHYSFYQLVIVDSTGKDPSCDLMEALGLPASRCL